MLTKIYIETLLVNEDLADQVWEAWDKGGIDDIIAAWTWWSIVIKTAWSETTTIFCRFMIVCWRRIRNVRLGAC